MIRTSARTSRRFRWCDYCLRKISRGDRYLEHVASPSHGEIGNTGWWRIKECADCARRYGRDELLAEPVK